MIRTAHTLSDCQLSIIHIYSTWHLIHFLDSTAKSLVSHTNQLTIPFNPFPAETYSQNLICKTHVVGMFLLSNKRIYHPRYSHLILGLSWWQTLQLLKWFFTSWYNLVALTTMSDTTVSCRSRYPTFTTIHREYYISSQSVTITDANPLRSIDWSIRFFNVGLDNSSLFSWCYHTWRIFMWLFMLSEHWTKLITSYPNILPQLDLTWIYITSRQLGYSRLTKIQSKHTSFFIYSSTNDIQTQTAHLAANHIQAWMVNQLTLLLLSVEGESQTQLYLLFQTWWWNFSKKLRSIHQHTKAET